MAPKIDQARLRLPAPRGHNRTTELPDNAANVAHPSPSTSADSSNAIHSTPTSSMEIRRAGEKRVQKVVVALDYGTTFSGAAFGKAMYRKYDDIYEPENQDPPVPESIRDWPGGSDLWKISSSIAYNRQHGMKWGLEVEELIENSSIRHNTWTNVPWAKLTLELEKDERNNDETPVKEARQLISSANDCPNDELDVVSHYLGAIWNHIGPMVDITLLKNKDVDVEKTLVLTVPAKWSWQATLRTYEAARRAGLEESKSGYKFYIIKEPEAAAVYALRDLNSTSPLNAGDCFIICDAGGGTIDLVSYSVTQLDPLILQEQVGCSGNAYGRTHIDIKFREHLRFALGTERFSLINPGNLAIIMSKWEKTKRHFDGEKQIYSVQLQPEFSLDETLEESSIKNGALILRKAEMKVLFQPIIGLIVNQIQDQIKAFRGIGESKDITLKALVLIGGLVRIPYIKKELSRFYGHDENYQIVIPSSDKSQTSVCFGAVLSVLDSTIEVTRISPFNFGYKLRDGSIRWFIRRGISLGPTERYREQLSFTIEPEALTKEVTELECQIVVSQSNSPNSNDTANAVGTLCMAIGSTSLKDFAPDEQGYRHVEVMVETFLTHSQITFKYGLQGESLSEENAIRYWDHGQLS